MLKQTKKTLYYISLLIHLADQGHNQIFMTVNFIVW